MTHNLTLEFIDESIADLPYYQMAISLVTRLIPLGLINAPIFPQYIYDRYMELSLREESEDNPLTTGEMVELDILSYRHSKWLNEMSSIHSSVAKALKITLSRFEVEVPPVDSLIMLTSPEVLDMWKSALTPQN